MVAINSRIAYLDKIWNNSDKQKRQCSVRNVLEQFFSKISYSPSLASCDPADVLKFLVWKDSCGKTKVHSVNCSFLGQKGQSDCDCPLRLATATVANLMQKLVDIFEQVGRGRDWDIKRNSGNPACAPVLKNYCKQIALEQAKAMVLPKQAKPVFIDKLKRVFAYIDRQLGRTDLSTRQRFVLMRDQAFFKIQFFAGDRASDLSAIPAQEVRRLNDNSGMFFAHTVTKTIRGGKGVANRFIVKRCQDECICPIYALDRYVSWCKQWGVDLSPGYLFRTVDDSGRVLDQHVTYSTMYVRFKEYLVTLGAYEGETPHSLRAGCSVLLGLSGSVSSSEEMMNHIGWSTEESAVYYSRVKRVKDAAIVAERLAHSVDAGDKVQRLFNESVESNMVHAFP